jgi:hypothetical protein
MIRLRYALTSLVSRARAPSAMSAFPLFMGCKSMDNILNSRPGTFHLRNAFSTFANSTLPSLSEAKDVLNSQGCIRVRKALEVDGRSKMDAKEFVELCRQSVICSVLTTPISALLIHYAAVMAWMSCRPWISALLFTKLDPYPTYSASFPV